MAKGDTIIWRKDKALWKQPLIWGIACTAIAGAITEGILNFGKYVGHHLDDAWSCGEQNAEIRTNLQEIKSNIKDIKVIVWQDHENILILGTKSGFNFDPPKEEIRIKQVLNTNTP